MMKHEIAEIRELNTFPTFLVFLQPLTLSSVLDEHDGKIYHPAIVSYRVKGDPADEVISLRAFAIIHRRQSKSGEESPESEKVNGGYRVDKAQVFIDRGPVMEKVMEVMAAAAKA